ncbi:HflK protein [Ventosimonas gracilis]|uniref:Protein HflK n=1 Tax=Ventosimonas gracilis TaxID=1680762 RepID=A0A139SMI3_9GAMM|nr:FtsH protease activity modulator HflK [Ventosimonas gracilis]KXU35719.1 HflK protein [Ventosimonas gracilis]
MAWNEPGGNPHNQDPWGNRPRGGNNQGPPDLDEAFRKLQDKLNDMFGGKKRPNNGGNNSGDGKRGSLGLLGLAAVVLLGFWLYNAIYVIDEQEQAVILRFGQYHRTVGPGLNFYLPVIERKFQENVTRERAYSKQGQMLTEDENIIEVPLTVQYRISNLQDFVLNVANPELSLQQSTDSAVRHVVGSTAMDQVLTQGRELMASEVKERLQSFMDTYQTGITVTQVNLQSAAAPREVQDAFDDVIRAREEEQREKNQAESYANGVVPEARGQAQRILEDASGYREEVIARAEGEAKRFSQLLTEYEKAPQVTRERLYLDSMQGLLSNTSKILLSGGNEKGGQNSLIYLPLDKLMENRAATATSSTILSGTDATGTARPSNNEPLRDLRSRESR